MLVYETDLVRVEQSQVLLITPSYSLSDLQQKAKNEELIQLAEQRKMEAERRRKEAEEEETAALRRQYERERQARVDEVCSHSSEVFSSHRCVDYKPNQCLNV